MSRPLLHFLPSPEGGSLAECDPVFSHSGLSSGLLPIRQTGSVKPFWVFCFVSFKNGAEIHPLLSLSTCKMYFLDLFCSAVHLHVHPVAGVLSPFVLLCDCCQQASQGCSDFSEFMRAFDGCVPKRCWGDDPPCRLHPCQPPLPGTPFFHGFTHARNL